MVFVEITQGGHGFLNSHLWALVSFLSKSLLAVLVFSLFESRLGVIQKTKNGAPRRDFKRKSTWAHRHECNKKHRTGAPRRDFEKNKHEGPEA